MARPDARIVSSFRTRVSFEMGGTHHAGCRGLIAFAHGSRGTPYRLQMKCAPIGDETGGQQIIAIM